MSPEALTLQVLIGRALSGDAELSRVLEQSLRPNRRKNLISSWSALLHYLRLDAHLPRERFRALYLDKKNRLIRDHVFAEGTVDHAPVYPREVARVGLELNACAVILVHNHPSGDATPSQADAEMTRKVRDALAALNITMHDHVVVGDEVISFRATGLL